MRLYFGRLDILKLICDKYNILYDEVKNQDGVVVEIIIKSPDTEIIWDAAQVSAEESKLIVIG